VYSPNVTTTARLDGSGGRAGTEVSFEVDLGDAERNDMPALLASVRLGERWRVEAEYLSLRRDHTRTLSATIDRGDNTYTAGTTVQSEFNSDIFRLSAGHSFVKDSQKEFGVALGLHTTDFSASIGAPSVGTEAGEARAPLPTLRYIGYDLSVTKAKYNGGINYRFSGPLLYLVTTF
jgi:hypothetical protein